MPPYNLEAEQAVLGCILMDKEAMSKVAEVLKPTDFYHTYHRIVYQVVLDLYEKKQPVDILVVTDELKRRGKLEEAGGGGYIADIATSVITSANALHYARLVLEDSLRRSLINVGTEVVSLGYQVNEEVDVLNDKAEELILQHLRKRGFSKSYPIADVLSEVFKYLEVVYAHKGAVYGIPTFYLPLDTLTAGFQQSDLIIIAARPSVGKTALALNIARNMAVQGRFPVGFFSLEMSRQQLVMRLVSREAQVNAQKLRKGFISQDEFSRLTQAFGTLGSMPFYIDDTSTLSVMELRSKARRMKLENDIKVLFIDYLQLITGNKKYESRVNEVSDITRALKGLARELEVPVVVLSQLSRNPETRGGDKRPALHDLRESGSIEQDADVVILLYRDDYYNPNSTEKGIVELNVAKQRNGPTDTIKLRFEKDISLFATVDTWRTEDDIPP